MDTGFLAEDGCGLPWPLGVEIPRWWLLRALPASLHVTPGNTWLHVVGRVCRGPGVPECCTRLCTRVPALRVVSGQTIWMAMLPEASREWRCPRGAHLRPAGFFSGLPTPEPGGQSRV